MINRFVALGNTNWMRCFALIVSSMVSSNIFAEVEIQSEITWETSEKNYKVVVTDIRITGSLPERNMLFYEQPSGKLIKKVRTMCGFERVEMSKKPSDCFVTVWSGGSAQHVEVYRNSKEGIDLIYEFGTKASFTLVPKDLCPDIIIPGNQYFYDEDKPDTYVKLSETYKSLPAITDEESDFG